MKKPPRRDICHDLASRMVDFNYGESACAWQLLAHALAALGDKDIPKFSDAIKAVEKAMGAVAAAKKIIEPIVKEFQEENDQTRNN